MKKRVLSILIGAVVVFPAVVMAHEGETFAYGEPGNPAKKFRVVKVVMTDTNGAMHYSPDHVDISKGEQIKFVVHNEGAIDHEFVLGRVEDNKEHAAMMAAMPDMKHDEPNAISLAAGKSASLLWQFGVTGRFEFACLLPGHYEAGMHGEAVVK